MLFYNKTFSNNNITQEGYFIFMKLKNRLSVFEAKQCVPTNPDNNPLELSGGISNHYKFENALEKPFKG